MLITGDISLPFWSLAERTKRVLFSMQQVTVK